MLRPALAAVFLALLGTTAFSGRLPPALPVLYLAASAASFAIYARDKSAARNGRRRVRENSLHLLALAGGWPGALVAQATLRHKTRKPSFQLAFWATVALNCAALAWLFGRYGAA